jgi:uncharacterized protein (TIGR03032 family)
MASGDAATAEYRDVRYEYSDTLAPLLTDLGLSVLISSYLTGNVIVVAADQGQLVLSFHSFERPMGLAARPGCLAVATRNQIWLLPEVAGMAHRIEPHGRYDTCYLVRCALHTGDIQVHELAWVGKELWAVNTLFSCLCTPHDVHNFVPRWRPPFISALRPEDRCHLNGLAVANGRPAYATLMAPTDAAQGWRPVKATDGCVMSVPQGDVFARGLCMPHSPRVAEGRVYLLNSGAGRLVTFDAADGKLETVAELPGYTRGLALHKELAFVALSRVRERSVMSGVPIADRLASLKCGIAVVSLATGRVVAQLHFLTGIDELFDVQLLPGVRRPYLSGPMAERDAGPPPWTIPRLQ